MSTEVRPSKPLAQQSAMELLETHAKALQQDNERLQRDLSRLLDTAKPGGSDMCITCAAHVKVITEDLEPEIERLTRELDDRRHLTSGIIEEKDRLREALDDAFDILKIALPCPRPWPTESDDSKLSIFRNIAEDRITQREGDNRDVSTERRHSAATVSGTPESYSCSDPRQDARTPAGTGVASPAVPTDETTGEHHE